MKPVRLRKIAKRDLREATAWYAERNVDVAARFTDEVARAHSNWLNNFLQPALLYRV